jgi:hypothetical protein
MRRYLNSSWLAFRTCLLPCALRVVAVAALVIAVLTGLGRLNFAFFAVGVVGLFVVAFWNNVSQIIESRSVSVGPVKLGTPEVISTPQASGSVRDNFLYLGNFYLHNDRCAEAFQFYQCAYRLKPSILSAFRSMQSAAHVEEASDDILKEWFYRALWHADGPHVELKDREQFAQWVREHTSTDMATLRKELLDLDDL